MINRRDRFKPFSRRLLCFATLIGMLSILFCLPVSAASTRKKAIKAYEKILKSKRSGFLDNHDEKAYYNPQKAYFRMLKIDNNNVPELLVITKNDEAILYTYKKGKVKQVECIGGVIGLSYYEKSSLYEYIMMYPGGARGDEPSFWLFGKGYYYSCTADSDDGKIVNYYMINGKISTKSVYHKEIQTRINGKKETRLYSSKYGYNATENQKIIYKNTKTNRKKYLK